MSAAMRLYQDDDEDDGIHNSAYYSRTTAPLNGGGGGGGPVRQHSSRTASTKGMMDDTTSTTDGGNGSSNSYKKSRLNNNNDDETSTRMDDDTTTNRYDDDYNYDEDDDRSHVSEINIYKDLDKMLQKSKTTFYFWFRFVCCLNPKWTLRTQLLTSFGTVTTLIIGSVMLGCLVASKYAADSVKRINQLAFETRISELQSSTITYLAESLEQEFLPKQLSNILVETTMDIFHGYNMYESDGGNNSPAPPVIFRDIYTGKNVYPIVGVNVGGLESILGSDGFISDGTDISNGVVDDDGTDENVVDDGNAVEGDGVADGDGDAAVVDDPVISDNATLNEINSNFTDNISDGIGGNSTNSTILNRLLQTVNDGTTGSTATTTTGRSMQMTPFPLFTSLSQMMELDDSLLVNASTAKQHVNQERWDTYYQYQNYVSTSNALYLDVSNANGGVSSLLYNKTMSIVPMMKSMFESTKEIQDITIYYMNNGVGSTALFPAYDKNTTTSGSGSSSDGCDWMSMSNPYIPSKTIGTQTQLRTCKNFKPVNAYANPMNGKNNHNWCANQALDPHKVHTGVELRNEGSRSKLPENNNNWIVSLGKSIYDRHTNEFIGCTKISMSLSLVQRRLQQSSTTANSHMTLLKYDELGTVIASTKQTYSASVKVANSADPAATIPDDEVPITATTTIDQLHIGVREKDYQALYKLVDYDNISNDDKLTPEVVRRRYENFVLNYDDFLVAASPIPRVPTTKEELATYRPEFFVIMSTSTEDVYGGVEQLEEDVEEHELKILYFAVVFGGIGWLVTCIVVCCMANALTIPLIYINVAAKDIVDSFGHGSEEAAAAAAKKRSRKKKGGAGGAGGGENQRNGATTTEERYEDQIEGKDEEEEDRKRRKIRDEMQRLWCAPKTELTDALEEFNRMVDNFSKDKLSKNEKVRQVEVQNKCKGLRVEFQELYNERQDPKFPYTLQGLKLPGSGGNNNDDDGYEEYQTGDISEAFRHRNSNIGPGRISHIGGVEKPKDNHKRNFITDKVGVITDKVGVIADKVGGVVTDKVGATGTFIKDKLVGTKLQVQEPNRAKELQLKQIQQQREEWYKSRLFLWIVGLIVTPLLITAISIAGAVMYVVVIEFEKSVTDAKDFFVDIELDALMVHARLRADVVGNLVAMSTRDLYFLTRYFGWLLFGGLVRADSFTEMLSGLEQCKAHVENETLPTCSYFQEVNKCDCEWNDKRVEECTEFPKGSRQFQKFFFAGESSNHLPDGDRNSTKYPDVATSPGTTEWWYDLKTVPGYEKGSSASGHDTLYDRLRVSSAMPLFPVLYNYDVEKENYLAQYLGFEADGLFLRTAGCDVAASISSSGFQSSESNGAAKLRPELCPLGKFGYDPRCRGWYDTGRKNAIEKNASLHITGPYAFASSGLIGQSATMALLDPKTGEHVGQVLNDFQSNSVFDALSDVRTQLSDGGFPILITVEGELDTIVGPGFSVGDDPTAISELVLPFDKECDDEGVCNDNENMQGFEAIVNSMKSGQASLNAFTRTRLSGKGSQVVYTAQAPAIVSSIRPMDPSDFASGVEYRNYMFYSLGLCLTREGLLIPFQQIERDLQRQLNWAIVALAIWIICATTFVVYVSYLVASSITTPMLYLLGLIRAINGSDGMDGEPPKIDRSMGSVEINNVSDTVLVLYKIVRAANDFYFAGELELAYSVLIDSVKLFKKLNNRKAVGVSSNNLGCTLLAMYKEMDGLGWRKHSGLTKREIIHRGKRLFQTAVKLGERNYNDVKRKEGRITEKCIDAMQTVANRYFNRALFLLTVKDDHSKPDVLGELGVECLEIVREMDKEFTKLIDISISGHKIFYRNLARARGHNMLLEMGYADDELMREKDWPGEWEIGELLDDCFKILQYEAGKESSELFRHVGVLGRLQELETELMKYKMLVGDVETAAKIAIRLIREDEYVFADSMSMALEVLVVYANNIHKKDVDSAEFELSEELTVEADGADTTTEEGNSKNSRPSVAINTLLYQDVRRFEKDLRASTKATRKSALRSISDQVSTKLSIAPTTNSSKTNPLDTPYWSSSKRAPLANWTKNNVSQVMAMEDF